MKKNKIKFNIAILGCGRVAQHYYKIFKLNKIRNINIVGVCDLKINKAKFFAKKYNSKYFTDLSNMINQIKIDLLIICTPSGSHYHNAKTALNNNINLLVEKPITMKPDQGKKLINIAKKKIFILVLHFRIDLILQLSV